MLTIVDYKTCNVGSLINMLGKLGVPAKVAVRPEDLYGASRFILPGIGHFDTCALNLRKSGFAEALGEIVLRDALPVLGICVGAQLLTRGSEEGDEPGLGWVDATTRRFPPPSLLDKYKVPHMGWNNVTCTHAHPLLAGFDASARFYFVHSYYIETQSADSSLGITTHANIAFASVIKNGCVVGVQFHPEKSHVFGMKLLKNFADWNGGQNVAP